MPEQLKSVFVSMGTPYRAEYETIRERLLEIIQDCGLRPRVINKTDYPVGRPLEHISKVMSECDGAIVVAFERSFFPEGLDKRGSKSELTLKDKKYTTPWNQIEAALAYKLGLPMLILAEDGVQQEGLIEHGHDWYVERFDLTEDPLTSRRISARLQEWSRVVRERTSRHQSSYQLSSETSVKELLTSLSVKNLWALIATIFVSASAVFTVGVAFGKYLKLP